MKEKGAELSGNNVIGRNKPVLFDMLNVALMSYFFSENGPPPPIVGSISIDHD